MKTTLLIICLAVVAAACSTPRLTTDSRKWRVTYPNPNDSTLVQVKGLYTNLGRIYYNNEKGTNISAWWNKETNYSPMPTATQIIAAEKIILAGEVDLFQPRPLDRKKILTTTKDTLFVLNKIQSYGRYYQIYICTNGDTLMYVNLLEALPEEIESGNFAWYQTEYYDTPDFYDRRYHIYLRTGKVITSDREYCICIKMPQYLKKED